MDFSKVSFDAQWTDSKAEMDNERKKAIIYAVIFAFTGSMLLISIIRTITTNPGNIPDHKEWDMSTEASGGEESTGMIDVEKEKSAQD